MAISWPTSEKKLVVAIPTTVSLRATCSALTSELTIAPAARRARFWSQLISSARAPCSCNAKQPLDGGRVAAPMFSHHRRSSDLNHAPQH